MDLFASLTGDENTELYVRLNRAGRAYDKMTGVLVGSPALAFERYIGAWNEVNGLLSDLNAVRPAGAPPAVRPVWHRLAGGVMSGMPRLSTDAPRAAEHGDARSCRAENDGWYCAAVDGHTGPHVAYLPDGSVGARWEDDPPEYDPEADAAGRAEEWAEGQREPAGVEAGERASQ